MQSKEEREKEILRRYDLLTIHSRKMVEDLNENWEERESLRSEYRKLSGKDLNHSS